MAIIKGLTAYRDLELSTGIQWFRRADQSFAIGINGDFILPDSTNDQLTYFPTVREGLEYLGLCKAEIEMFIWEHNLED